MLIFLHPVQKQNTMEMWNLEYHRCFHCDPPTENVILHNRMTFMLEIMLQNS